METTDLNFISVIATVVSCLAAIAAFVASWKANQYQKTIKKIDFDF